MLSKIIGASVATGAGVGIVALAGAAADASSNPPFSMTGERFDQSQFLGRWKKMLSNFDPVTLLSSDDAVKDAVKELKRFQQGGGDKFGKTDAEWWGLRKLKESAVHPDTGDIIPRPARMAGYVPFNGPVCVAMMVSSSTPTLLFWNWVNQSQNAFVNYFNRNASASSEGDESAANMALAKSYGTAVSAAIIVAFGVSQFIIRRYPGEKGKRLLQFVALPSSCVASSSNAYIMRRGEIDTGISLIDEDGKPVGGASKVAATKAVQETVLSRIMLQFPVFFIPPALMSLPPIAALAASSSVAGLSFMSFFTTVAFGLGLPATVAYFPQIGVLTADEVEPEFREKALKTPSKALYYNKGL